MLPTRAYSDTLGPFSPGARAEATSADARPVLVVAVARSNVEQFPANPFARFAARSTGDAIRLMERWRPRVVAVDWDNRLFDAKEICATALQTPGTGVLVTMDAPEAAPAALKAGCHALLLKPLTLNLVAARLGRLTRELAPVAAATRPADQPGHCGTHRTWPEVACPKCAQAGAIGFEYSSYRRSWYACMGCEAVWLGRRRE
jgi:CheY-like chemotaxis protein